MYDRFAEPQLGLLSGGSTLIGRKSTMALADAYKKVFAREVYSTLARKHVVQLKKDELYDFLYASEYDAWFLQLAKTAHFFSPDVFRDFIMHLHTGDSIAPSTPTWTPEQRSQLGQQLLKKLAEDLLVRYQSLADGDPHGYWGDETIIRFKLLVSRLELDGYVLRNGTLQLSEAMVVNAEEESGVLQGLISDLNLNKKSVIKHHLDLSETHYVQGKWDDCISNSRKFLECILQEIAATHCHVTTGQPLEHDKYTKPFEVRKYLEKVGLFDTKETKTLAEVYGLLSNTGSHPYIAAKDQARLMRYLALTTSELRALLRYLT